MKRKTSPKFLQIRREQVQEVIEGFRNHKYDMAKIEAMFSDRRSSKGNRPRYIPSYVGKINYVSFRDEYHTQTGYYFNNIHIPLRFIKSIEGFKSYQPGPR